MMPQMDLIAELKKRQVKPQVTDGAIDDIITGEQSSYIVLRSVVSFSWDMDGVFLFVFLLSCKCI